MSQKTATLLTLHNGEESARILQYLDEQLTKLNYTIIENNPHTTITKEIFQNADIILVSGDYRNICEYITELFQTKLIKNRHLESVYKAPVSIPQATQILQVQNYANGVNPVGLIYRNIYALPTDLKSVKLIFEQLRLILDDTFGLYGKHFQLACSETERNQVLNFRSEFVVIKKYCYVQNDGICRFNIVLNSDQFCKLVNCVTELKKILDPNTIMCERVHDCFWKDFGLMQDVSYVRQAVTIIEKCYTDYTPDDVILCFNGGKDCTVLLYLTLYVLRNKHPDYKKPLLVLYIKSKCPFVEVEQFIEQCQQYYGFELVTIDDDIKVALGKILNDRPNLKACLMGTRRTDPHAENSLHFQYTDSNWPQIMRVSPVLDWNYADIWKFLLTLNIPYCNLYDLGYTSLGSQTTTVRNPALQSSDQTDNYLPAFKLLDGSKERDGRIKYQPK